jgi:hypothetical protein
MTNDMLTLTATASTTYYGDITILLDGNAFTGRSVTLLPINGNGTTVDDELEEEEE